MTKDRRQQRRVAQEEDSPSSVRTRSGVAVHLRMDVHRPVTAAHFLVDSIMKRHSMIVIYGIAVIIRFYAAVLHSMQWRSPHWATGCTPCSPYECVASQEGERT